MAGLGGEGEEVLAMDHSQHTLRLDNLVGHIERIILSEEFVDLRESFLQEHCQMFDDCEENKLEYMDIYHQYLEVIEGYLEEELSKMEEKGGGEGGIQLPSLLQELSATGNLEGEVFDLLMTFTDFLAFKTAMLEVKKSQEEGTASLADLLQVTSLGS